jgi:hypothetical protein
MAQKPYFRLAGKCPVCGRGILDPFSRFSGPVPYFHSAGKGRPSCRLIVTPDHTGGDSHSVQVVPRSVAMEAALEQVLGDLLEAKVA